MSQITFEVLVIAIVALLSVGSAAAADFPSSAQARSTAQEAGQRADALQRQADACYGRVKEAQGQLQRLVDEAKRRPPTTDVDRKIADLGRRLKELLAEKEKVLQELRRGLFCSICYRSKYEIEKGGETFEGHLKTVKGRPVPAPKNKIDAKAKEYDRRIAALRGQGKDLVRTREDILAKHEQRLAALTVKATSGVECFNLQSSANTARVKQASAERAAAQLASEEQRRKAEAEAEQLRQSQLKAEREREEQRRKAQAETERLRQEGVRAAKEREEQRRKAEAEARRAQQKEAAEAKEREERRKKAEADLKRMQEESEAAKTRVERQPDQKRAARRSAVEDELGKLRREDAVAQRRQEERRSAEAEAEAAWQAQVRAREAKEREIEQQLRDAEARQRLEARGVQRVHPWTGPSLISMGRLGASGPTPGRAAMAQPTGGPEAGLIAARASEDLESSLQALRRLVDSAREQARVVGLEAARTELESALFEPFDYGPRPPSDLVETATSNYLTEVLEDQERRQGWNLPFRERLVDLVASEVSERIGRELSALFNEAAGLRSAARGDPELDRAVLEFEDAVGPASLFYRTYPFAGGRSILGLWNYASDVQDRFWSLFDVGVRRLLEQETPP